MFCGKLKDHEMLKTLSGFKYVISFIIKIQSIQQTLPIKSTLGKFYGDPNEFVIVPKCTRNRKRQNLFRAKIAKSVVRT